MHADAVRVTAPPLPSLTRRASLTAIAALLDYSAKLAVGLLVTPVLVHGLGRAVYGMWEMLQQLIGYMSAADGRPTDALRLVIANRQGTDDAAARRRQVGAALVVWVLFLPLIVAVGFIAVWLAPTITHAAPAQHGAVRLAAGLLVLSFVAATLAAVPEAVLRGMNLGYKRMGWQAGLSITGGLLLAAAVTGGFGLAGLGAAQVILFALTGLCFWVLARRYVADFGVARPTRAEVKSLVGMSVWLALGDLIAKLLLASDVIILGMVVSPTVVTTYVLTGYAARTANGVLFFTIGSAMPGIGGLVGQQQFDRAAALRGELLALTWLFAIGVGAAVLAWNPSFLGLWVGGENYAGGWVNVLVVCVMTQTMFIRSDSYLIDVALKPRLRVVVGAAAAAVTVGAAIPLTRAFGILGLCAGMLIGRATQSIAYPLIAAACLHRPARLPWRAMIRPLAATVALFAGAAALGARISAPGWAAWGLGVAGTATAAPLLALGLGLPAPARQAVLGRLRDIARAVRG
jgi:O-antigen/teichoic acid export membrane protein